MEELFDPYDSVAGKENEKKDNPSLPGTYRMFEREKKTSAIRRIGFEIKTVLRSAKPRPSPRYPLTMHFRANFSREEQSHYIP